MLNHELNLIIYLYSICTEKRIHIVITLNTLTMTNNHITNATAMADLLCFINMKHFKHHARNVMLYPHDLRIVALK